MLSKPWFLEEVREKILPRIKTNENRHQSKAVGTTFTLFFLVFIFYVFLFPNVFVSPKRAVCCLLLMLAEVFYALYLCHQTWGNTDRRQKEKIRPFVLNILDAAAIDEKRIDGQSVKQLQKNHFLPDECVRVKNEVRHDILAFPGEVLPFNVQEVAFRRAGKKALFLRGVVVRFSLPEKVGFRLMGFRKVSGKANGGDFLPKAEQIAAMGMKKVDWDGPYLVFSSDAAGTRDFLTAAFWRYIKRVEYVYGAPVNFWLTEDELTLFVRTRRDMFEFRANADRLDSFESFYDQVRVLADFYNLFSD